MLEEGYESCKRCCINISSLNLKKLVMDDLNKVKSCVKLAGYVNSTDDFVDQPKVINGASELMTKNF